MSSDRTASSPAAAEAFEAVELLEETSTATGWSVEYRQLERGRLRARARGVVYGGLSLIRESANLGLEVFGEPPDGAVFVLLPLGTGGRLRANGLQLAHGDMLVVMPGTELHMTTFGAAEAVSMHLRSELLRTVMRCVAPDWCGTEATFCLRSDAGRPAIHALTAAALTQVETPVQRTSLEHDVVATLAQLLTQSCVPARDRLTKGRVAQLQVLTRAREYIEAHVADPVRMPDVCAYAGASQSTLERLFRLDLQVPPSKYIAARRLETVRRALARGDDVATTVTDIATAHGFLHLGRFAAAYREQYGEYPSEALRAPRMRVVPRETSPAVL